jgi:hypothetical protein
VVPQSGLLSAVSATKARARWKRLLLLGGVLIAGAIAVPRVEPIRETIARVERRVAVVRIPIADSVTVGTHWALRADSGFVVLSSLSDAVAACASLGAGWALPADHAAFPELTPWPTWPVALEVWMADGGSATLGTAGPPPQFRAPPAPAGATYAVLCFR